MSGAAPARSQPGRQNIPQQRQRADEKKYEFQKLSNRRIQFDFETKYLKFVRFSARKGAGLRKLRI